MHKLMRTKYLNANQEIWKGEIRSKKIELYELVEWAGERLLSHLLWDYFEERGYKVYGEVEVGGYGKIDLVCTDGDIIGGVEVKRKKRVSSSDIEQISGYLSRALRFGELDDFILIYEVKSYSEADSIQSLLNLCSVKFYDQESKKWIKPKMFNVVLKFCTNDSYELVPPYYQLYTYNEIEFEKRFHRKRMPRLTKNESTIEHKIWRKLRKDEWMIVPQTMLKLETGKSMEVDLLAVKTHLILAIEVKGPRGRITEKQAKKYRGLPESIIPMFIVPNERKIRRKEVGGVKILHISDFIENLDRVA